jgi:hypothetical protein
MCFSYNLPISENVRRVLEGIASVGRQEVAKNRNTVFLKWSADLHDSLIIVGQEGLGAFVSQVV